MEKMGDGIKDCFFIYFIYLFLKTDSQKFNIDQSLNDRMWCEMSHFTYRELTPNRAVPLSIYELIVHPQPCFQQPQAAVGSSDTPTAHNQHSTKTKSATNSWNSGAFSSQRAKKGKWIQVSNSSGRQKLDFKRMLSLSKTVGCSPHQFYGGDR